MLRARKLAFGVLSGLALVVACKPGTVVVDRPIRLNTLASCPVSADKAYAVVYAWGDTEPVEGAPQFQSLFLRDSSTSFEGLSMSTRTLVADVSQPSPSSGWRALSRVADTGPIDLLLLPRAEACRFTTPVDRRTEATLGAVDSTHVLVAGGKSVLGQVPRTYLADVARGTVVPLPTGLGARRLSPSITSFDAAPNAAVRGALVAGGADPDTGAPLKTAEVYVPSGNDVGDFSKEKIELNDARAEHGAVVLASGETLLVGGRGAGQPVLRSLEVIDPIKRGPRIEGLAVLEVARKNPTVIRLASGEILVAGGEDANGVPVPTLEWLSADASRTTKRKRDLVASKNRAFVPLDTGGALAVIAPDLGLAGFKSVWIISADGALEPAIPVTELSQVRLFQASDGAPLLFTGKRWLRWQPWFGAFQQQLDAPDPVPGEGGPLSRAIASPDPGLAVWLDEREEGTFLRAYRHGVRDEFAPIPRPLLVKDQSFLAPDRLPSRDAYRFELDRGLLLGSGASAFLPDVTFGAVTLELRVTAAMPLVVLRDPRSGAELEVGGPFCPIVARETLTVRRSGAKVSAIADGGEERPCTREVSADARLSVGLRGAPGGDTSGARNLFVRRE